MDELRFWLALNAVPGLGARRAKLLLGRFGGPRAVLGAPSSELRKVPGIGPELTQGITSWKKYVDLEKEFRLIEKHEVEVIVIDDSSYPGNLAKIFYPPLLLSV